MRTVTVVSRSDSAARRAATASSPAARLLLAALALLATALLSGCSSPDNPTEVLADYNNRLGRLLDLELPPASATRVPTWPAIADIEQTPTDIRIDLFSLPDFGRCGLLREVSARDRVLDRLHSPSQRLLLELRLLRGLRQCAEATRQDLDGDDTDRRAFATTIQQVLELKTRDLPLVYWNATFGAPELRDFFSVSTLPLRLGETRHGNDPANALAWLAVLGRISPDAPLPAGEALDQQYYQLVGNRLGGRIWLSLDLGRRELERSTKLLQQAAARGDLCPNSQPSAGAEQLHALYLGHFEARVQPWLDSTAGNARTLGDALESLWQVQQITAPPALSRYRSAVWANAPGSLREDFHGAVRQHVLAWRAVLGPCGFATPPP